MMRGQVTFIALIGVIAILAAVGVFFVLDLDAPPSAQGFADLELALSSCLEQDTNELIKIAAAHGGEPAYATDVPIDDHRSVRDAHGDAVPVWVSFDGACTSGSCLSYQRPKLHPNDRAGGGLDASIEEQFEIVLDASVEECLVERAEELNVTARITAFSTDVTIADEVRAQAQAQGSFSRDSRSTTRLSASTAIGSSFLELFETATAIAALEARSGFLGAYTNDVIALGSGVDAPYPPVYAYEFSFAPRYWTAHDVEEELAADLEETLPLVHLTSSRTPDPSTLPYTLRRGLLDLERSGRLVGDRVFLSVEPLGAPSVSLNDASFVTAEPAAPILPFVGDLLPLKQYRTAYDVESTTLVTLTSREDGLALRFALEPRVENNEPMRADARLTAAATAASTGSQKAQAAYCSDPTGADLSLSLHGAPAGETSITYACGANTCTYPFSTTLTLPTCIGGRLTARSDGVIFDSIRVDSRPSGTVSASLQARKRHDLMIEARVHETRPIRDGSEPLGMLPGSQRDLRSDERMIVRFEGVDTDRTAAAIVTSDGSVSTPLYEGTYLVSVNILRNVSASPLTIPEREHCHIIDIGFCLGGSTDIEEVTFEDTLVLGQYEGLGPVRIDEDATVTIALPIFDLATIPESSRRVEDLGFYEFLPETLEAIDTAGVSVS